MAGVCDICGKKPISGCNVSHANNRTKRLHRPNIHTLRVRYQSGPKRRMNVCTRCLRSGVVTR